MNTFVIFIIGVATGVVSLAAFLAHYGAVREEERRKRKRTNADRIRGMTDLELAAVIMCPYCGNPEDCKDIDKYMSCSVCCYEWLREEDGKDGNGM